MVNPVMIFLRNIVLIAQADAGGSLKMSIMVFLNQPHRPMAGPKGCTKNFSFPDCISARQEIFFVPGVDLARPNRSPMYKADGTQGLAQAELTVGLHLLYRSFLARKHF